MSDAEREKIVSFKRRGEVHLRNSGLGYTVVRPGPLVEEAGGYKAMIFDQGSRITEKISCADVADVCLKALHDQAARNISFEVRVPTLSRLPWHLPAACLAGPAVALPA